MSCGGPSGGHEWRFRRFIPEWPRTAHGLFFTICELLFIYLFDVLFQYDNYCSSPPRLTLRRMWIWLADQVSSWLRAPDCVLACASDLSLGTAV